MSMAIKYGLMKRAKKMAPCDEHGAQGCEMCHGGMMAKGGEVKKEAAPVGKTQSGKDIYPHHKDPRHKAFTKQDHLDAMEHHVNAQGPLEGKIQDIERQKMNGKRGGYDHSGQVNAIDQRKRHAANAQAHSDAADDAPEDFAEGGEVTDPDEIDGPAVDDSANDEESDMIGRIMKQRYAKGGIVRKEEEPLADFESTDFDDLDQIEPDHAADYTGANSGDEIGNEQEDDDRRDIVSRIMKSRAKKDRMPRPA